MTFKICSVNPKVTKDEITGFELCYKLALPSAYISFLLDHNGGRPTPSGFAIRGFENNPAGVISDFFGLKAQNQTDDLEWNLKNYAYLPKSLLPIACTPTSDLLCLDMRKGNCPISYFHTKPSWGNQLWDENDLYFVADSFPTLLQLLYDIVPPGEEEVDRIFRSKDANALELLLQAGVDPETRDEYGRTFMERAAIAGSTTMIQSLVNHDARLGNAIKYAEQNAKFFPGHLSALDLLRKIQTARGEQQSSES